ncbi:MAG: hypothetical protein RM347_007975 [Nostoc sp. ChiQUE02]|uniref:hypothetical protein n=1 Tax=Nostoc sp. ChiQUE02 TaxID=3075377 RepID=UPI002AD43CDA|nr:hypothetical protein [Nostoc sp. ChiQUE02]MDZ8233117.1 hypothetical protein [Nostoc sp. ChiQUE02]
MIKPIRNDARSSLTLRQRNDALYEMLRVACFPTGVRGLANAITFCNGDFN